MAIKVQTMLLSWGYITLTNIIHIDKPGTLDIVIESFWQLFVVVKFQRIEAWVAQTGDAHSITPTWTGNHQNRYSRVPLSYKLCLISANAVIQYNFSATTSMSDRLSQVSGHISNTHARGLLSGEVAIITGACREFPQLKSARGLELTFHDCDVLCTGAGQVCLVSL